MRYAPVTILAVRIGNVEYEVFVTVAVVIRNTLSAFRNPPALCVPLFKGKAYARVRSLDYDLTGVVQCDMRIVRNETIKRFQPFSVRHHRLYRSISVGVSSDVAQFFFHLLRFLYFIRLPNTHLYTYLRKRKVGKYITKNASFAPIRYMRIRSSLSLNFSRRLSLNTMSSGVVANLSAMYSRVYPLRLSHAKKALIRSEYPSCETRLLNSSLFG